MARFYMHKSAVSPAKGFNKAKSFIVIPVSQLSLQSHSNLLGPLESEAGSEGVAPPAARSGSASQPGK